MLFFSICLLVLLGLSLTTFAAPREMTSSLAAPYANPPRDWPDIPVEALGVFQKEGRINQTISTDRPTKRPVRRFKSFDDTQSFVLEMVDPKRTTPPLIGLQLSKRDGPDWTDVILDGHVVAHVETQALMTRPEANLARQR